MENMTPLQLTIAENVRQADSSDNTVWLLTVSYEHDEESEQYMMERQSLHRTKDDATRRLFDVVQELSDLLPDEVEVIASSTREDGAQFSDLDAGEQISYGIVPLTIEGDS